MRKIVVRKLFVFTAALATVGLFGFANAVQAAPVAVTNAGFETPVLSDGSFSAATPSGWDLVSGSGVGVFNPTTTPFPGGTPEGSNAMFSTSTSVIGQTTGETIDIGDTFTLTVALGNRADLVARDMRIHLAAADGTIIASSAIFGEGDIANGTFADVTASFTADAMTAGLG
ncbi:MAG: hypothetical protein R3360_02685, partial [Alphaproteobacteria bacterium]|nr:hypothetical protein [Alphaproteobacteria bacterium]